MGTFTTKDANNVNLEFEFEGDGSGSTPFIGRSRVLLGETNENVATSPTTTSGLHGLIAGLWQAFNNSLHEEFNPTAVTVGTSLTTIIEVDVRKFNFLSVEVNNGTAMLAECQVQARYNSSSSAWNPKTFGANEYTTGTGKQSGNSRITIIEASGDLNDLGSNSSGWVEIDCSRYESVRLQARVLGGTTNVTCRAIAKQ